MRLNKVAWLWAIVALAMWNCSGEDGLPGPQGIPGPQGPPGPAGPASALVYEVPFTLTGNNNWEDVYEFPQDDVILESDVVLAYTYEGDTETSDGGTVAIWRLMPVTEFYDEGILQFSYDYSQIDVRVFIGASFPLDPAVDNYPDFTVRIVVIPADYAANARKSDINYENYYEIKKAFGLSEPVSSKPLNKILKGHRQEIN